MTGYGFGDLAADLAKVDVPSVVSPVLSKAGYVMRDGARQAAPRGPHIPAYASTIIMNRPDKLTVEVGAKAVGQGNLSAILEYGQGRNAPHPHIVPQLEPEADKTIGYLAAAVVEALS